jgi:hypothetical protein
MIFVRDVAIAHEDNFNFSNFSASVLCKPWFLMRKAIKILEN